MNTLFSEGVAKANASYTSENPPMWTVMRNGVKHKITGIPTYGGKSRSEEMQRVKMIMLPQDYKEIYSQVNSHYNNHK